MHGHVTQSAGSPAELAGDRLQFGGGNFGADLLGGYIGSTGTASTWYAPGATSGPPSSGAFGGVSALSKVVIHIAAFWIISIGVLILLHRAGFRFSLTVG